MKFDKTVLKKLYKMDGEIRGTSIKTDVSYVLMKYGNEGVKKLENKLKKSGYPIKYKDINNMQWYPIGLKLISFLSIIELFELTKEDVKDIGENAPKVSVLVKLALKFFSSFKKFTQKAAEFWQQHYTIGHLDVVEADEKKGVFRLYLKGIYGPLKKIDEQVAELYIEGYLESYFNKITQLAIPNIEGEMKKIIYKGEECYEFIAITKK